MLIVLAIIAMRRSKLLQEVAQQQLLLTISLPLIAVVWFMSLFKDTLPHWTGPAYTTLIPLAAAYLAGQLQGRQLTRLMPPVVKAAIALPVLLLVLLMVGIRWLPVKMGARMNNILVKEIFTGHERVEAVWL